MYDDYTAQRIASDQAKTNKTFAVEQKGKDLERIFMLVVILAAGLYILRHVGDKK